LNSEYISLTQIQNMVLSVGVFSVRKHFQEKHHSIDFSIYPTPSVRLCRSTRQTVSLLKEITTVSNVCEHLSTVSPNKNTSSTATKIGVSHRHDDDEKNGKQTHSGEQIVIDACKNTWNTTNCSASVRKYKKISRTKINAIRPVETNYSLTVITHW